MCNQTFDNRLCWGDISLYMQCPRCFWALKHKGIKRPGCDRESFRLPSLMDQLRKDQCDRCRKTKTTLNIFEKNNIEAFPFEDEEKSVIGWRKPFYEGGTLEYHDEDRNIIFSGSLDDVFINPQVELIVVEFKSTSTKPGESLQKNKWFLNNRLQVMFYALLLSKNKRVVHNTGYLIYSDALSYGPDGLPFNNRLYFKTILVACPMDYLLLERILNESIYCLRAAIPPAVKNVGRKGCKFCNFVNELSGLHGAEPNSFAQNFEISLNHGMENRDCL